MIELEINKTKKISFQLEISGAQSSDLKGSMKIITEKVEYGFPIKISNGEVIVEIPPLNKISKIDLIDGQSFPAKLEIIADNNLITPWEDSFIIRTPFEIKAKVIDEKEKPIIKIKNIKENQIIKEKQKKIFKSKISKIMLKD